MATTDIFSAAPSYWTNTDPNAGWAISGDSNPSTCVGTSSDSKIIQVSIWDLHPTTSPAFYSYGISGLPTYISISSVVMNAYEGRSGTGPGQWKYQYSIDGTNWYDAIAGHTVNVSYTLVSSSSLSRPGGGSWSRTDVGNLQARIVSTATGTNDRNEYVDKWYFTITWDYITPTKVQTDAADNIGVFTARIKGTVNPNGDAGGQYRLVYGSSSGSYDSPSWNTVTAGTEVQYTRNLSGLNPGQTYYFRVEYKNSGGTQTNGSELTFKTLSAGCLIVVE